MMRWALQIICKHNLKFLVMFPRALLRTPYKRIMSSSKPSSNQATSTFQPIRILLLLSDNQWVIFAPSFSDQSGFFKNWATNECSSPSPRIARTNPMMTLVSQSRPSQAIRGKSFRSIPSSFEWIRQHCWEEPIKKLILTDSRIFTAEINR